MNSVGRGWSVELMRGDGACQPGLACANAVTDGRKSFPEQFLPSPPAGVASLEVVRPERDAPHGVKRAGFGQTLGTSALKVLFHGRFLRDLSQKCQQGRRLPERSPKQRS